jgi:hypothetical protein
MDIIYQALLNTVMELRVLQMWGISWEAAQFLRKDTVP